MNNKREDEQNDFQNGKLLFNVYRDCNNKTRNWIITFDAWDCLDIDRKKVWEDTANEFIKKFSKMIDVNKNNLLKKYRRHWFGK